MIPFKPFGPFKPSEWGVFVCLIVYGLVSLNNNFSSFYPP